MNDKKTTRDGAARPLRVLVVEDSARDAELVIREINRGGFDAKWRRVENEADMKAALDAEPWDLVISDYRMPHFDGLLALRVLHEKGTGIPFIIISGTIGEETAVAAMKAGAHDYLMKNNLARLAPAVERELREAAIRSEHKRTEMLLQESHAQYEAIFQSTGTATLLVEEDTTIVAANHECLAATGYTPEELIGTKWPKYVAPESLELMLKYHNLRREEPGKAPRKYEVKLVNKKGEIRNVILDTAVIPGTKRSVVSMLDITERVQAEDALRISSSRREALLAAVPDIIMEVDSHKVYTWANQAGLEFFGEDVVGKEANFYFEGEQETYTAVAPLFNGGDEVIYVESWQRRRDGQRRLLAWWCRVLKDAQGVVTGALSAAQDITERKRVEKERQALLTTIEQEKIKLAAVIDGIADEVWFADKQKIFTLANPSALREFGLAHGDTIEVEKLAQSLEVLRPDGSARPLEEAPPLRGLAGETVRNQEEIVRTPATGELRFRLVSTTPVRDPSGGIAGAVSIVRDVTEFRRAENALRESDEQLRLALEAARAVAWVSETDGEALTEIGPVAEVFGKPAGFCHANRAAFIENIHPDDRARVVAAIQACMGGEMDTLSIEFRIPLADGGIRWLQTSGRFERASGGQPGCMRGIVRDITERRQAEEALRESEEKYRLLIDNAQFPVVVVSATDARVLLINELASRMFEVPVPQAVGLRASEFWCRKKDLHRYITLARREGIVKNFETELRSKSGAKVTVLLSSNLVEFAGQKADLTVFQDITERKLAEEALRASEAQLSNALQMARAGHWEYDVINDIFTFNDNFYRIFRTTAEQVGGYKMSSKDYAQRFCHPDDAVMVGQETRAAIESADPSYGRQLEHRILYADGEVGYMTVRFFIVKNSQGRTVKTYGVNQDITDRKRAGEELHHVLSSARCILWHSVVIPRADGGMHWEVRISNEDAAADMLPLSRKPGQSYSDVWHTGTLPEDRERIDRTSAQAIREGKAGYAQEYRCRTTNEEIRWLAEDARIQPLGPDRWLVIGVCTDVTSRREAEEKMEQQLVELRRWHEVTLGREERVAELKLEVNELAARVGEKPKYGGSEK